MLQRRQVEQGRTRRAIVTTACARGFALVALFCAGCGGGDDLPAVAEAPVPKAEPAAQPSIEALRARADVLWKARRDENWSGAWLFLDPVTREEHTAEEFAEWSKANEPFIVREYDIRDAVTENMLGWVSVSVTMSMRQMGDFAPTTNDRWEKWRFVAGDWYPVPQEEVAHYPAPPAERDLAEEAKLKERFEGAWDARMKRDWMRLYGFTDPSRDVRMPDEAFAEQQDGVTYMSKDLLWMEVIGDRGRAQVLVVHKINDPNMTKLPPRRTVLVEQWVKFDGVWYLDMGAVTARGGTE